MVEYQNWYQVLRPIGSFVNERSRVEILKPANESDLKLREKIRSIPFRLRQNRDEVASQTFLTGTPSNKSTCDVYSPSVEEIIMSRNLKKRADSDTYLSPKFKDFQDQEKEIKSIFWNLQKTVDPECSDDIDVEAIRDFLRRRQQELGREELEKSDVDVFDKYGLGLHARQVLRTSDEDKNGRPRGSGVDRLMSMIDKMVDERTKPTPDRKDMYDKNNPIQGKVGFRRDEINGPLEYTDLDEQLDFGDLDKNVDFNKFLEDKGRGRFNSEGNFILFESDMDIGKTLGKDGKADQKKSRKNVDGRGDGEDDSTDDGSLKSRRDKFKAGRPRTASEMMRYLNNLKKPRRYPEWDFPMCNYPKWVHRMYRMDQEKIGQLIKQGMDVPEYCPSWMMNVMDRVWGAKDTSTRGQKPSEVRGRKLNGRETESSSGVGRGKGEKKTQDGRGDTRGTQEMEGKTTGENAEQYEGPDLREVGGGLEEGGSKTSFGIGDFLQGYEREMIDLAKLEAESEFGAKRQPGDTFDINDMIAEYENQLQHEEDLIQGSKEREKSQMEAKLKKMNERREHAKNKIADRDAKRRQEERINFENERIAMAKKPEELDESEFSGMTIGGAPIGKRRDRKFKKIKKVAAETGPCSEFTTTPGKPSNDEECMRRFKVLLQGQNRIMKENEFIEVVRKISSLKYDKAPPPKTPCDRVKLPICY